MSVTTRSGTGRAAPSGDDRDQAAPSPRRRPSVDRRSALTAATVLAVALGAAARFSARGTLWLDEAISVDISRLPVGQIGGALRQDGHPPLYYLLLHAWTGLFGTSALAVRSLSGIISLAMLPLIWAAGRRLGGRRTAAVATVLLATSPFSVRYATETRMYALCGLLALAGLLAVLRATERPTPGRLVLVAAVAGATVLTHYWGIWLVGAAVISLLARAWRRPDGRRTDAKVLAALVVGSMAFVPWLSTAAFQAQHTGTPWARSVEPLDAVFDTLLDLGGGKWVGGRLLGPLLGLLVLLALVAVPMERWRLAVDLRTVPGARRELAVAGATMLLGLGAAVAASSAYQPRYAAGVVPLVLLAAAVGVDRLPNSTLRIAVVAVVAVVGLAGSWRATQEPRTQAGEIAAVLAEHAAPGDVVAYCPDQLRPAVQRELDLRGAPSLQAITLPGGSPAGRVDWVDYRKRIRAEDPVALAARAVRLAGPDGTVWLVSSPSYRGFGDSCEQVQAALADARGAVQPTVRRDTDSYERAGLRRYPPR
ncbi:hypothetical protein BH10ACT1_BH10ACT1_36150 [soil metagenome]